MSQVQTLNTGVVHTVETNKVIKNTYLLLSMTLLTAAGAAMFAMSRNAAPMGIIPVLAVIIGFPFLINFVRNSVWALPLTFVYTGLFGYILGPIIGFYLNMPNGSAIVFNALATTAVAFLGLSGYALVSRKNFSFLGGFVLVGFLVIVAAIIANIFFALPALSLAISAAIVMLSVAGILYTTSEMIHGGETNYVLITIALFAHIANMFLSLMRLFAFFSGED